MRYFFYLLGALLTAALPIQAAFADDNAPPTTTDSPDPSRAQVIAHQAQVTRRIRGWPGFSTTASSQQGIGTWTIEWANAAGYTTGWFGSKYVRHEYARTRRVSGPTGSYQAEAHATLIDGRYYGGTQVFNYFTHSCAKAIVNNATAQTCSSPWQSSSSGRDWLIVSGHYFDIGINGIDADCPGCIDWVYTTP